MLLKCCYWEHCLAPAFLFERQDIVTSGKTRLHVDRYSCVATVSFRRMCGEKNDVHCLTSFDHDNVKLWARRLDLCSDTKASINRLLDLLIAECQCESRSNNTPENAWRQVRVICRSTFRVRCGRRCECSLSLQCWTFTVWRIAATLSDTEMCTFDFGRYFMKLK